MLGHGEMVTTVHITLHGVLWLVRTRMLTVTPVGLSGMAPRRKVRRRSLTKPQGGIKGRQSWKGMPLTLRHQG
jgi:hypothetical protein